MTTTLIKISTLFSFSKVVMVVCKRERERERERVRLLWFTTGGATFPESVRK